MFFGKTNSRGLLRQNWAKFSFGTTLPPNAPCSQLGLEERYEAGFVKKFRPKTCFLGWMKLRSGTLLPHIARHLVSLAHKTGEVWFSTKIQTENVFFGKTNLRGLLRQNWAKFSSGTILPPNAPYSQLGPEKGMGPVSSKNSDRKRVFWDGRNYAPGPFLPPTALSKPFGP